jgi:hypothetical protein
MTRIRSRAAALLTAAALLGGGFPVSHAQTKPTVAILPLTLLHLPELSAPAETERIRQAFVQSGRFEVLSEAETASRLRAAGVRDERCHEVECAVEFGAALKVAKLFTAQILRLGRRTILRVRYVDVPSARADFADSIELAGQTREVKDVLQAVLARILGTPARVPAARPPVVLAFDGPEEPFYTRWWFLMALGVVVAAGTATGLVLGLRSSGPATGSATFGY